MSETTTPTSTANCRPGMNPGSTDFQKCSLQARADAVASVRYCLLPLEPQNPPTGFFDGIMKDYRNSRESTAPQCSMAELAAKPRIYHVPAFTTDEQLAIIRRAIPLATEDAQNGKKRHRERGRD